MIGMAVSIISRIGEYAEKQGVPYAIEVDRCGERYTFFLKINGISKTYIMQKTISRLDLLSGIGDWVVSEIIQEWERYMQTHLTCARK